MSTTPSPDPSAEPAAPAPAPRRSRAARGLLAIAKLAVAVAVLALAYRLVVGIDWNALALRVRSLDPALAALALALLLGRYLVWQARWGLVLQRLGEGVSRRRRAAAIVASVAVNHATPYLRVFGAVCRARYMARRGRRTFAQHYGGVLFEVILHNLVFGALLWIAGVGVAWREGYRWPAALAFAAGAAALGYLLFRRTGGPRSVPPLVEIAARKAHRQSRRLRRLATHSRELAEVLRSLFARRRLLLGVVGYTLLYGLCNAASQWLTFVALGIDVGPLTVILVVGGGVVVGTFTGTPGGVATTEAAMAAGYAALGVDPLAAAAATLLYRGIHYAVVVGLGVPALLYFEVLERQPTRRSAHG